MDQLNANYCGKLRKREYVSYTQPSTIDFEIINMVYPPTGKKKKFMLFLSPPPPPDCEP